MYRLLFFDYIDHQIQQQVPLLMLPQYKKYRELPYKVRRQLIQKAEQQQKHRKPNPQQNHQFDEYRFIDFFVWEGKKKIRLQTYRKNSKKQPIGIIFMFHGLNSHIGHGAHMAAYFSEHGFTTVGFDYRGFGRSEGVEGYVDNLNTHLQDCKRFIDAVMHLYKDLPKFALGLSMGGMTSYYLTLQDQHIFDGAILMAPALKNSLGTGFVLVTKLLNNILPDKTKLTKPIYGRASKNPAITQFVKQDKYTYSNRMSLSTLQMLVSTMDKSSKTFKQYNCPFMIIQGGLDKLVDPQVAFQLFQNSKTPLQDKQILFYENMWHDIWHQEQIHDILPRIVQWINKRIQKIKINKKYNFQKIQQKIVANQTLRLENQEK